MIMQTQSDRNPIDQDTWLNQVFLHTRIHMPINRRINCDTFQQPVLRKAKKQNC